MKIFLTDQSNFLLKPDYSSKNGLDALVKEMKEFISNNSCENLTLDLRGFNLIYASQLGILVSTFHFINYINGSVEIVIDNEQAKAMIDKLNLSNASAVLEINEAGLREIA